VLAFFLALAAFSLLSLLGLAVLPKKISSFDKSLAIYLSPAIGLSVIVVTSFSINRIGIPLKFVGFPLLVLVLICIVTRRRRISEKLISPSHTVKLLFAPILVLFTAWPILKFGFSWLSYVNDDMNNYVLATTRFLNNGFFTSPTADYYQGKDYSQLYYYMHVDSHVRSGSEIYLAIISSITNLPPIKSFMPAILALQMTLIFGALALSRLSPHSSKRLTRITFLLAIISSMMSLGYLYQLIAQVGGLAIGIAFICVLTFYLKIGIKGKIKWDLVLIGGGILSAQFIWYPEFLVFVSIICVAILMKERKNLGRIELLTGAILCIVVITLLNKYFFDAIRFGIFQISSAQSSIAGINSSAQLFPYFLNPHGLTSYIGIAPLNRWFDEPWESIGILLSFLVLFSVVVYSIYASRLLNPATISLVILFFAFCYLLVSANGFGAFKISMFAAPFLIVVIAEILHLQSKTRPRNFKPFIIALFIVFSLLNVRTAQFYSVASTGTSSNGFNEIQNGSGLDFVGNIRKAITSSSSTKGKIVSTSVNLSQIKLEAIAAKGFPLFFSTTNPFENIFNSNPLNGPIGYEKVNYRSKWGDNSFSQPNALIQNPKEVSYLISKNKYDSLNRSTFKESGEIWNYEVSNGPENLLSFIDSSMGPSYYKTKNRQEAVFFQAEKNPLVPGNYMQSVGDDFLIQVAGISREPVLVMNISTTVIPQYNRQIPEIYVQGATVQRLNVSGNGSGQYQMPLGKPLVINGQNYYHFHISQDLAPFPIKRSFIGSIYGRDIELDARRISLFLNNLSVIDKSELKLVKGQNSVSIFPDHLLNKNLVFSGVYEDGWVGADSYFDLSDHSSSEFLLEGVIPELKGMSGFENSVSISIDGKKLITKKIGVGSFSISVPWSHGEKNFEKKRVSIQFAKKMKLPTPDDRPVSAKISFVGFKKSD